MKSYCIQMYLISSVILRQEHKLTVTYIFQPKQMNEKQQKIF